MRIRQVIHRGAIVMIGSEVAALSGYSSLPKELRDPRAWLLFDMGMYEVLICQAYFTTETASLRWAIYALTRLWAGRDPNGP